MTSTLDHRRVRHAALRVGLLVALSSAVTVGVGVGILVAILVGSARPEVEHAAHERRDGDAIVVDLDRVLPWVILLGLLGIVILGAVGWLAARSAVRPLDEALSVQRAFVADASHELRTPLTTLAGRVQLLERRLDRGEPIEGTVRELRHDTEVMRDVLTDMLLTAEGAESGSPSADTGACVAAAVATLAPTAAEHAVTIVVDADPSWARMPPVTLTRLCVALLDNAVHHTPDGTRVLVTARRAGAVVEIRVSDSGPGIADRDVPRLFERFARGTETGRGRGFGLGLALVREAATRYGGTALLESTSPEGSVFVLRVPAGT